MQKRLLFIALILGLNIWGQDAETKEVKTDAKVTEAVADNKLKKPEEKSPEVEKFDQANIEESDIDDLDGDELIKLLKDSNLFDSLGGQNDEGLAQASEEEVQEFFEQLMKKLSEEDSKNEI